MNWIKNKVEVLIDKYDTNVPNEIADYLGINLLYEYLGNIKGLYIKHNGFHFIIINVNLDYYDQRVVCAHELGHAVLHPTLNMSYLTEETFFSKEKFERQANEFSAHLLLPDNFHLDPDFKGRNLEEISEILAIPKEIIKFKFY